MIREPSGDNISPSESPVRLPGAALCPRPAITASGTQLPRTSYPGGLGGAQSEGEEKINKRLRTSKTKGTKEKGKNANRVVKRMNVGHRRGPWMGAAAAGHNQRPNKQKSPP